MTGKVAITFGMSEKFADFPGRAAFYVGNRKGEIVGYRIPHGVDIIRSMPFPANGLLILDRRCNNIEALNS